MSGARLMLRADLRCLPRLALATLALAAGPAAALDCAALRSSSTPFEFKLQRAIVFSDREPAAAEGRLVVLRKDDGVVTYQSFAPDSYFRTHYLFGGFPDEFFVSSAGTKIKVTYSSPPSAALFAEEKPTNYHVTMTRHDGQTVGEQDHAISFLGHRSVELAGCDFEVVRSLRKVTGTLNDKYSESETEFWYSPELKTSLYIKTTVANGPTQTYTATDISLEFKPFE